MLDHCSEILCPADKHRWGAVGGAEVYCLECKLKYSDLRRGSREKERGLVAQWRRHGEKASNVHTTQTYFTCADALEAVLDG